MAGGVSIIHVGGYTETEMNEKKKDRVDDALHATKLQLKKVLYLEVELHYYMLEQYQLQLNVINV